MVWNLYRDAAGALACWPIPGVIAGDGCARDMVAGVSAGGIAGLSEDDHMVPLA